MPISLDHTIVHAKDRRASAARAKGGPRMNGHRHLALLALAVGATAMGLSIFGFQWFWFGAGTAAIVITIHVAVVALALAFGGPLLLDFVATGLHRGFLRKIDTAGNGRSKVIHRARAYDLLVWALLIGRERTFREKTLDLARVTEGESVLDVGCGTGTLAIAAKRRVGKSGKATGVDASTEMIERARKKASKAGVDVDFQIAAAERLPFQNAAFDVVLSTVMLHHLPEDARARCIGEIRRVLKPAGRVLAIDFGGSAEQRKSVVGRLHAHAHFDVTEVLALVKQAGLAQVESGPMGFHDMHFIRAAVPAA
jgi:ubiquinone/menaquinone biosynthesis C-methylase UbiE